jgi:hypothetical protein
MNIDPDMHIGLHLVSFGKSGVTGGGRARDEAVRCVGGGEEGGGRDFQDILRLVREQHLHGLLAAEDRPSAVVV